MEYPIENELDISQDKLNNLINSDEFKSNSFNAQIKFISEKNTNNLSFIIFKVLF